MSGEQKPRISRRVVLKVLGASSVVTLALPACNSDGDLDTIVSLATRVAGEIVFPGSPERVLA